MPNTFISGYRKQCVYRRTRKLKKHEPMVQGELFARGFGYTNVLVGICVLTIGGLYLMAINTNAVRGSQLYDAESKVAQLKTEQEELRIKEAELRMESQSQERIERLQMKEIDAKNYIIIERSDHLALDY